MKRVNRREFLQAAGKLGVGAAMLASGTAVASGVTDNHTGVEIAMNGRNGQKNRKMSPDRPNIILAMTDDQGWGDVGYHGHGVLQTPTLDEMADSGVRFDRFYAAAPVCSPTRGSCITGRHPYRYGVFHANSGHILPAEITLAEALKTQGYTTGHFGKWHLGTLTKTVVESNRGGPRGVEHYSPPWDNGFDVCFSTEAKVPTYNPMQKPGSDEPYGTWYWREDGRRATENLMGDDSELIMDRVVAFLRQAAENDAPFLAVVWFHTPHLPVLAGPDDRAPYSDEPGARPHYYGALTAMDRQMGRMREELRKLGIAEDTMLWFCSDNGPEGKKESDRRPGSTGWFRGRKRSLFEGGIRVPGILEWRGHITSGRITNVPCCTADYYPTIMELLGFEPAGQPRPIDGINLLPLIEGEMEKRPSPIAFETRGNTRGSPKLAYIGNRYKLLSNLDDADADMLFDIIDDREETNNLAAEMPDMVTKLRGRLGRWRASCDDSRAGCDYD